MWGGVRLPLVPHQDVAVGQESRAIKIVFDMIVTSSADRCSTVVQFVTLAKLLLQRPDVFIYWPVPDSFTEDDYAFLPKSDRIQYIPVWMPVDRMKEYNRMPEYLLGLLYFIGPGWDWDVVVTVRTCQVPWMRVAATSIKTPHMAWTKRIYVIEDMLLLSKKPSVGQSNPDVQDRQTIEGMLAADRVFMPAYHQIPWIMEVARLHFSMARVREISHKLEEVCHLNMPGYSLKDELYDGSRKLEVAFVGRISRHGSRIKELNELFVRHFIMHGERIHPFVCTVSSSSRGIEDDVIDVYHPNREEFHKIARTKMDLAVYFYLDVELNMSMLEPISMGVPAIVADGKWSRAMVGDNYPFFVRPGTDAYGMVLEFQRNYAAMYAKFAEWFEDWFVPTYTKRIEEQGMYSRIVDAVLTPNEYPKERLEKARKNRVVNDFIRVGGDEFVMEALITEVGEKEFGSLPAKAGETWKSNRGLVWHSPWNDYRLALIHGFGYEDASTITGHLRKRA